MPSACEEVEVALSCNLRFAGSSYTFLEEEKQQHLYRGELKSHLRRTNLSFSILEQILNISLNAISLHQLAEIPAFS